MLITVARPQRIFTAFRVQPHKVWDFLKYGKKSQGFLKKIRRLPWKISIKKRPFGKRALVFVVEKV